MINNLKGFLEVKAIAYGNNHQIQSNLYFNTDAGYKDTARMLAESSLSLLDYINSAADQKKCGGFYTPSSLLAENLLQRLTKNGQTKFKISWL